ncbi:beta-hexosaminidase [Maritimibacter sp. 55A14]|uniref:glycoside hydrolase family 3 N-terminal domain-containing protein n=1 Tax=Maritimibacter sp. 55A14 TaxID=2174844 RepID=UPI000D61F184|nr:glycoside hydrolase family 3 N-terminal domain-containing protein [Maritimibacter sp. 55A14]PWE33975.1 beta-hexosaminidase [Maritimibacter sp. 55A14]
MAPAAAILGCAGEVLGRGERRFFARAQPWGFILFARNVADPVQLVRLTGDLRDAVGRAAPVFVDQEGGRVARLRPPHWRDWPPALDQMRATGPRDGPRAMWLRARLIAAELAAVGIDGNCAPLADIATPATHPVLRNRCYGETLAAVVPAARATAEGLLAGGVLPVLKHIPGHGRATRDSHAELPRVTAPRAVLEASDFAAFRALAQLPLGMTAHIVYDCLDPEAPATQSAAAIRMIREEFGFGGLLMSDDISMSALQGDMTRRSAAARAAGCDLVLHCNGDPAEMADVVAAAGALEGPGIARAAAALEARRPPEPADVAALEAEYSALTGRGRHGRI